MQRLAAFVAADIKVAISTSSEFPDLNKLAAIGSNGRYSQHCHKDLITLLSSETSLKPGKVETPVRMLTGKPATMANVPVFDPHATMATLYEHHRSVFNERILPDVSELERFWTSMSDHPQLVNHPVKERRDWKRRAIPVCIHGDGVPLTGLGKSWSKFMDVCFDFFYSWHWNDSSENVSALGLFYFTFIVKRLSLIHI